jgi:hypothetical protein
MPLSVGGWPRPNRLDAGRALTLASDFDTRTLPKRPGSRLYDKQPLSVYAPGFSLLPPGLLQSEFLKPGTFHATAPGGFDVGPFNTQFPVARSLVWSNRDSIATVDTNAGVTVTWTGGDPAREYAVIAGAVFVPELGPTTQYGAIFSCAAPVDAKTFTVPPHVFSALPRLAPGGSQQMLAVGTGSLVAPNRFLAPGLDAAFISQTWLGVKSVTFR